MSVMTFTVIVLAIWSPTTIARAVDPSCALTMVNTSPTIVVTRTISALESRGRTSVGHTVQLNGATGNSAPSPAATSSDVPEVAGEGATAMPAYAKFLCWSMEVD
jgi:hypothetical protein